jgi:lysylphosphatidylglycerol synthetase-like protein (DUF2156 family)
MRYRDSVAVLAYLALAAAWVYVFLDRGFFEGHDLWWLVAAGFALAHVALGFIVGRCPVVLLPLVLVPLAIPAGYPESMWEPPPVWLTQTLLVQFEVSLVALGLGARAVSDRCRPARAAETG